MESISEKRAIDPVDAEVIENTGFRSLRLETELEFIRMKIGAGMIKTRPQEVFYKTIKKEKIQ